MNLKCGPGREDVMKLNRESDASEDTVGQRWQDMLSRLGELCDRLEANARYQSNAPMTREQAAALLQIHPDTLYRLAKEGVIAYIPLNDGQRAPMRFLKEDLDAHLRRMRVHTTSEAMGSRDLK
jgi:excisionase family DNA binding protein